MKSNAGHCALEPAFVFPTHSDLKKRNQKLSSQITKRPGRRRSPHSSERTSITEDPCITTTDEGEYR
jgi:hypothetical protein